MQIIEELKELVNSDETLNHTFTKFRELQQRWKETGLVPQQNVKDLWETYNLHVENFYNFIKINKELRDLDLKKNYEQKLALCEAAEALVLEPSIVEAFHKLQKLHDEWRETGPVANEFKETLWERFKEASSRINKQHQAFFENIKAEQTKNLELKAGLCEQTEELAQQLYHAQGVEPGQRPSVGDPEGVEDDRLRAEEGQYPHLRAVPYGVRPVFRSQAPLLCRREDRNGAQPSIEERAVRSGRSVADERGVEEDDR